MLFYYSIILIHNYINWLQICRVYILMQIMSQNAQTFNHLPTPIKQLALKFIKVAKSRHYRSRQSNSRSIFTPKTNGIQAIYEKAKKAETIDRDLKKALGLYTQSVAEGQKIDSCIKDFASILHQMGYTKQAVDLLIVLKGSYKGDIDRFQRLKTTLQKQITPSGKHGCKGILFELPNKEKPIQDFINSLFENTSRIKQIKVFNHLSLNSITQQEGKWLYFLFQSFSAAKKTLEKFKFEEWFGINKFWVKEGFIMCEATDGRQDFEKGLVVTKQMVDQYLSYIQNFQGKISQDQPSYLHYYNECAKDIIENDILKKAEYELAEIKDQIIN